MTMGISFTFKKGKPKERFGYEAKRQDSEFMSEAELKQAVRDYFGGSYSCPQCGGHKIKGKRCIVEYYPVTLLKEQSKKGLFGRTKYFNEKVGVVWGLFTYFENGAYIRCMDCKWEQTSGEVYPT